MKTSRTSSLIAGFLSLMLIFGVFGFAPPAFAQNTKTIKVTSPAFKNGQRIPAKYATINETIPGSQNISIPLKWTVSPAVAPKIQSFAISIIDLHKATKKWVHLLVINLPPEARDIEEGAFSQGAMAGTELLLNSYGALGYGGPNPPAGTGNHVYAITVYGLKEMLDVDPSKQFTEKSFQKLIKGKVVAKGQLRGKFGSAKAKTSSPLSPARLEGIIWMFEKQLRQEGTEFLPVSDEEIIGGKVYYEFKNNTVCLEGRIADDGTPGACDTYYPYSIAGNTIEIDISGTINKFQAAIVNGKLELTLGADSGAAMKFVFNKWQGSGQTSDTTRISMPSIDRWPPEPCEVSMGFTGSRLFAGVGGLIEGPLPLACTNLKEALKEPLRVISLDLSNKGLTELSPDIGKLVKLQDLNLSGNQLTELPAEIANLEELYKLDAGSNQLSSLPAAFSRLTNIEYLFLYGNNFTAFPPPLEQLTALKNLNISFNQITSLPAWISKFTVLQTFDVSYNKLTRVTPEVGALQTLWTLIVSGNPLTDGEDARIKAALPDLNRLNDEFLK